MGNRDLQSENNATHPRPKNDLEVSDEEGGMPKMPHEHDESAERQTGGPKPPDPKRNLNIGPQKSRA